MSVWIFIGLIALVALLAMVFLAKLPRKTWELLAAFLVLGLVGYAIQGRSDVAASPAVDLKKDSPAAQAMLEMRSKMVPEFDGSRRYTITADSMARSGNYPFAVAWIRNGLREYPENSQLWAALGVYTMLAADGQFLEPSLYAFAKAEELGKNNPVPDYFLGVAALVERKPSETVERWSAALQKGRKDGKWKADVEAQLAGLVAAAERASAQKDRVGGQ